MADDIEYITFDNDELQTTPTIINGVPQPQQTVFINGTVEVDYTTNTFRTVGTNGLTVTQNGHIILGDGGSGPLTSPSTNQFQFTLGDISASYTTPTPAQADGITYNSDPGQSDNVEYFSTGTSPLTSSTTNPTCFATGTAISTANGPVAVEDLAVGDMALTNSGESRRVRWIGHRTLDCRHPSRETALPIRIAAHAFAENRPSRDLLVSPGHAICIDVGGEVLIPASALVNGTSVVREDVGTVTYWHVELDSHDILLAENLPCESYLDMGNRGFFVENGIVDLGATPDATARTHADFCRPFHASGALVDAVRARLDARAEAAGKVETARAAA